MPFVRSPWLVLCSVSLAPLIVARLLSPSTIGIGTHTQLGLPACGFLQLFHVPCPACGLTTSFAHLAHGDLPSSLFAHVLGLPLALLLLGVALRALVGAVRGESFGAWLFAPPQLRAGIAVFCALGLVWCARLASTLAR